MLPITVLQPRLLPNDTLDMTEAFGLSPRVLQGSFVTLSVDAQALQRTDADGDGLPDDVDACLASDLRPIVMIDGCDGRDGRSCPTTREALQRSVGGQKYQDFETCAICIDTVKTDLKQAVIACVMWGHWIQNPWFGGPTHGGCYIEDQTPTAPPPKDIVAWQGAEPPTQTFLRVTKGHVTGDFLDRIRIIASNRRK